VDGDGQQGASLAVPAAASTQENQGGFPSEHWTFGSGESPQVSDVDDADVAGKRDENVQAEHGQQETEEEVDWEELDTGERLLQPIPSPDSSVATLSQALPPPIAPQPQSAAVPAQPPSSALTTETAAPAAPPSQAPPPNSTPTTPGSAARTTPRNPKQTQTTLVGMRQLLSPVPNPPGKPGKDKPPLTLKDPRRPRR
jgi:hypothetical protein